MTIQCIVYTSNNVLEFFVVVLTNQISTFFYHNSFLHFNFLLPFPFQLLSLKTFSTIWIHFTTTQNDFV